MADSSLHALLLEVSGLPLSFAAVQVLYGKALILRGTCTHNNIILNGCPCVALCSNTVRYPFCFQAPCLFVFVLKIVQEHDATNNMQTW